MSKAQRVTGAAFAGLALGLIGVAVAAVPASADPTPDMVITSSMTNVPDDGDPTPWARDTFVRTTKIYKNADNTYLVKIQDNGTFKTVNGAFTPGDSQLLIIGGTTGTFTGQAEFTVSFPAAITAQSKPMLNDMPTNESFDYTDCLKKGACGNELPTTGTWPKHRFRPDAVISDIRDWGWTYTTDCETRKESVTLTKGNITGMTVCPKPAPDASVSAAPIVLPKPSASTPVVAQPSLPVTGNNVPVIVGTAGALMLIGGAAYYGARRRKAKN